MARRFIELPSLCKVCMPLTDYIELIYNMVSLMLFQNNMDQFMQFKLRNIVKKVTISEMV